MRFVGAGAFAAAAADTVTPSLPSGILPGDFLVVFAGNREDSPVPALSVSGYQEIGSHAFVDLGTSGLTFTAFYKFATGSESNPVVDNTGNTTTGSYAFVAAWRGVDPTTPLDGVTPAQGTSAAAATFTPPNITPGTALAWIISAVSSADDNDLIISAAQSFNTRASGTSYHSTTGSDMAMALTDREIASPASTTLPTYQQNAVGNDAWAYKTFVLRANYVEWEELFNGAADGVDLDATNSSLTGFGSGSGTTKFETEGTVAPNAQRYCRVAATGTARVCGRTITQNTGEKDYFRFYFRTDDPANLADFWRVWDNVNSLSRVRLDLNASGQINVRDGGTTRYTSTKALGVNEWVRIEVRINDTNDTLSFRLFWGANIHGTTPDEEATGLTWTPGTFDTIRFGVLNSSVTAQADFDAMAHNPSTDGSGSGFIGPVTADANEVIRLISGTMSAGFSGSATGDVPATGVNIDGTMSAGFTGSADATVVNDVSGTMSAGFTGSATAEVVRNGTATASIGFSGSGSATVVNEGSGTGSYGFSGTGSATAVRNASGTLQAGFSGSATATVVDEGGATLSVGFSGTADAEVVPAGVTEATGSFGFAGSASATVVRNATATGSYGFSGTAATVREVGISATLTAGFAASASATRLAIISGTLPVGFSATSTGSLDLSVEALLEIGVILAATMDTPGGVQTIGQLWPRGT